MLAAKASLCIRVDALGEEVKPSIGIVSRSLVEQRLRECEQGKLRQLSGSGKTPSKTEKYKVTG